jgi:hypothetical protein
MKKLTILYCITLLGFLLGIHKGKVAVWVDHDPKPAKVFPYSARLLPAADRKRLEKGIHFETKEELVRTIEDYLS